MSAKTNLCICHQNLKSLCWCMHVAQSCLTLCNPMDCIVHGILQARILEWVAFPFSRGSSQPGIKPRSPTLQANSLPAGPQEKPKSTGVGSLSPSLVDLADPRIKLRSPALQVDSLPTELSGLNWIQFIFTQSQMVSTIPYSLKSVSLKVMPTVGTMGKMHIPRTGEMVGRLA